MNVKAELVKLVTLLVKKEPENRDDSRVLCKLR